MVNLKSSFPERDSLPEDDWQKRHSFFTRSDLGSFAGDRADRSRSRFVCWEMAPSAMFRDGRCCLRFSEVFNRAAAINALWTSTVGLAG